MCKAYFDFEYLESGTRPSCKDCHYNGYDECSLDYCYYEEGEDDESDRKGRRKQT